MESLETVARLSALVLAIPARPCPTEKRVARALVDWRNLCLAILENMVTPRVNRHRVPVDPPSGWDRLQLAARLNWCAARIRTANRRRVSVRADSARWALDIEQLALEV